MKVLNVVKEYEPYLKMTNPKLLKHLFGDVKDSYAENQVDIQKVRAYLSDCDKITKEINIKLNKDKDSGFY